MKLCPNCTSNFCSKTGICERAEKVGNVSRKQIKESVKPVFPSKNQERVPLETKRFVFKRDGNKCVICDSKKSLTLDHIRPRVKGGSNEPENLQCMCRKCNVLKGKKLLTNEELKLIVKFENQYRK